MQKVVWYQTLVFFFVFLFYVLFCFVSFCKIVYLSVYRKKVDIIMRIVNRRYICFTPVFYFLNCIICFLSINSSNHKITQTTHSNHRSDILLNAKVTLSPFLSLKEKKRKEKIIPGVSAYLTACSAGLDTVRRAFLVIITSCLLLKDTKYTIIDYPPL